MLAVSSLFHIAMPTEIELRSLAAAHLGAALAIEAQTSPHPWTRGDFEGSLLAGHWAQGLWRGSELLGYCLAMPAADEAHLLNIAVAPPHQRHGLAQRLMRALLDWARAHEAREVWLEVRAGNARAQRLYLRLGFAPAGRRPGYYPCPDGSREDALLMRLALAPHHNAQGAAA